MVLVTTLASLPEGGERSKIISQLASRQCDSDRVGGGSYIEGGSGGVHGLSWFMEA